MKAYVATKLCDMEECLIVQQMDRMKAQQEELNTQEREQFNLIMEIEQLSQSPYRGYRWSI